MFRTDCMDNYGVRWGWGGGRGGGGGGGGGAIMQTGNDYTHWLLRFQCDILI